MSPVSLFSRARAKAAPASASLSPPDNGPEHSQIWKTIRHIEIQAQRRINQLLSGQYHSTFKGSGLEFEEVTPYHEGDDERHIDWNVTARTGSLHVKRFIEEREMSLFLVVDHRAAIRFGSQQRLKTDLAVEFAALIAFSALRNQDRVGLLTFGPGPHLMLPARRGRQHALLLIRQLLNPSERPVKDQETLDSTLRKLNHLMKRRGIVFVLSDFVDTGSLDSLKHLNQRHECIAVQLKDPLEETLPDVGWAQFRDPETGQERRINTSSPQVRAQYTELRARQENALQERFKNQGIDHLQLRTSDSDVWKPLLRYYRQRLHR